MNNDPFMLICLSIMAPLILMWLVVVRNRLHRQEMDDMEQQIQEGAIEDLFMSYEEWREDDDG